MNWKKNRLKYLSATWPVLEDFLGLFNVSLSRHNDSCSNDSFLSLPLLIQLRVIGLFSCLVRYHLFRATFHWNFYVLGGLRVRWMCAEKCVSVLNWHKVILINNTKRPLYSYFQTMQSYYQAFLWWIDRFHDTVWIPLPSEFYKRRAHLQNVSNKGWEEYIALPLSRVTGG